MISNDEWKNRVRADHFLARAGDPLDSYADAPLRQHVVKLLDLGVFVWVVDRGGEVDTVLVELPERVLREVVAIVAEMRADEVAMNEQDVLRLRWGDGPGQERDAGRCGNDARQ